MAHCNSNPHPSWEVLSLRDWFHNGHPNAQRKQRTSDAGAAAGGLPPTATLSVRHLLDVRSECDLQQRQIGGTSKDVTANVVHIPLEDLKRRRFELPPRQKPFAILVPTPSGECLSRLKECLMGQACVSNEGTAQDVDARSSRKRRRRQQGQHPQKPWNVLGIIDGSDENSWKQAETLGLLHSNKETVQIPNCAACFQPLPRLWEPDEMVKDLLLPMIVQKLAMLSQNGGKSFSGSHQSHRQRVEIWDLGAGAGRDACFLAEELKQVLSCQPKSTTTQLRVVAMDQRYRVASNNSSSGASECVEFFERRGVGAWTQCFQIDLADAGATALEQFGIQAFLHANECSDDSFVLVVYAVRFWDRRLVQDFVVKQLLQLALSSKKKKAITVICAISHFGKPSLGATWNFDHPKEKHVLGRSELADIFAQKVDYEGRSLSWNILHDRVATDGDHGRTLIQFVAEFFG